MKLRISTSLVVLLALLLMLPATSVALRIDPDSVREVIPAASPSADDGGAWEVGAHAAGGDLYSYAYSEASNLYSRLGSCGWNRRYLYGAGSAWEEDFKRSAAGGTESSYLDTVDLQFYVGHGSTGGFTFDPPYHDDSTLTPSDCNRAWGDGDNEWVALTSCQVLSDPNLAAWAACFNGSHLIAGFVTNAAAYMGTATTGYRFADYLCNAWTVTSAWFKACDVTQPAGRKVRVLANETACYDDKPGYYVCSDSYDTDAWYWDHTCGSETPGPMDIAALDSTMPVFRTQPLSLADAQRTASNLGTVFSMPPPAAPPAAAYFLPEGDEWRSEDNGRELQLDRNTGMYTYYDPNQLWKAPTEAELATFVQTISADDARTIADNFLRQNNLMPPDARFYEVVSDTLGSLTASAAGLVPDRATEAATAWQVVYSRYVSATFTTASGRQMTHEFLVIGPGAKEKVYVSTQVVLAASGSTALVLGNQGGWPKLQQPLAAGVDTVPILPVEQIYTLFNLLESKVVINTAPIDADRRDILSHTVNYWSNGFGQSQSELIPVYSLNVRYSKDGAVVATDWAYVPANPTYIPPFARIDTAPTGNVHAGQQVTLAAADATQTLAQLGVDPSLTFTLGNGDYKYDWYVDSVAEANRICGGRTINYTVRPQYAIHDGVLRQQIIVKVTDLASSDQRSATASVTVTMDARRLTLPLILK